MRNAGLGEAQAGIKISGRNIHNFRYGDDITFMAESEVAQSCLTLCNSMTVAYQAPQSKEFSRQEYWRGLPFPSPRDLPNAGIKPRSPTL